MVQMAIQRLGVDVFNKKAQGHINRVLLLSTYEDAVSVKAWIESANTRLQGSSEQKHKIVSHTQLRY